MLRKDPTAYLRAESRREWSVADGIDRRGGQYQEDQVKRAELRADEWAAWKGIDRRHAPDHAQPCRDALAWHATRQAEADARALDDLLA